MDKMSNSKFQFRIPNKLSSDFKLACHNLGVKPSEKLRELINNLTICDDFPEGALFDEEETGE